jgi:sulfur relay (sulfurtransferase) complex TusBCD TusD component (DsrE family)
VTTTSAIGSIFATAEVYTLARLFTSTIFEETSNVANDKTSTNPSICKYKDCHACNNQRGVVSNHKDNAGLFTGGIEALE